MKKVSISSFAILILLVVACGENSDLALEATPDKQKEIATDTADEAPEVSELDNLKFRLDLVFANHGAAPVQLLLGLLKDEKEVFHPDYVNDVESVGKYSSDFSAALNYGVYKTDLMYDLIHHHLDDGINAREAANQLADQLWEEHIYSEDDIAAYEAAIDNHAELEHLLYLDYEKTEKYLISHNQFEIAALTMIGTLIESMYFTSKAIEEHGVSESKYKLLLNEKHQLDELIDLLGSFKEHESNNVLLNELVSVQSAYGEIDGTDSLTEAVAHQVDEAVFVLRDKVVSNTL
jgi:hypothetical protein